MNLKIDLTNNPAPHNQSGTNRWGGVYKSKRELAYIKELTDALTPLTVEQYKETPLQVSYTFCSYTKKMDYFYSVRKMKV